MAESFNPKRLLSNMTTCPGIYQMLGAKGEVLYIGKARNLKNRLSSYFRYHEPQTKTAHLVSQICDVKIIITHTENEALLLESNLIKKHLPRFNILLRDDKSYPFIHLTAHKQFPRMEFYRAIQKKVSGKLLGPFPSGMAVRECIDLIQKLFQVRSCDDSFFANRSRPCLQYQIKRCSAPCVDYISVEDYQANIQMALLFLQGKNNQVVSELTKKMDAAAAAHHYELAAIFRDQIARIRHVQEKQHVTNGRGNVDVIAVKGLHGHFCVQIHVIRSGRLLGHHTYFPTTPEQSASAEVLSAFLTQYYLNEVRKKDIPEQIIVNKDFNEMKWCEKAFSEERGHNVSIACKVRGDRLRWLAMTERNAEHALQSHLSTRANYYQRFCHLQKSLGLEEVPERIECFDISHTSGQLMVASCVVFDINGPVKKSYRAYNITDVTPGDDYAALYQAMTRRLTKLKSSRTKLPDILFIDGGKGQLTQGEKVLRDLQIEGVLLVAIAKGPTRKAGLEVLHMTHCSSPLSLPSTNEGLHLIQHLRDEAHRFAVTSHRHRRAKVQKASTLETIPGVGAKRRQELLRYFGGIQALKRASVDDIVKVRSISHSIACLIYEYLHGK